MEKKLQRIEENKMVAGVCTGLAEYFDVDLTWIRIAFVLAVILGASGILAYIVLWIAVPQKPYQPIYGQSEVDFNTPGGINSANTALTKKNWANGNGRFIAGSILIVLGLFFLLDEFNLIPQWMEFEKLWPVILIAFGVFILSRSKKKASLEEALIPTEAPSQVEALDIEPAHSASDANQATEEMNKNTDPKQD